MSSEHSRSTTITNKHGKTKVGRQKNQKLSPPKISKLGWNQSLTPYTPEHVLKHYPHYLDPHEKEEIL